METTYKKNKGCAGLKGIQFQIHLIIVFFLNALHKLKDWKISTENENASKFDDVVLELADKSLVLLQAKHRENKKVTKEQLLSTNSKNDDFSLLKYFFSYQEIKNKYTVRSCIICTNTNIDMNGLNEFLIQKKISSDNLLYFEDNNSLCYNFSEKLLPDFKVNAEIYYEKNLRGKRIDEARITDKDLKEFLEKLEFFSNFPSSKTINSVIEQMLSRLDTSVLWFQVYPKELYKKIEEWFQQHRGKYLTEDRAKVIFCEIRSERYCEQLKALNVQFDDKKMHSFNSRRIFYTTTKEGHFLQILKIYHDLQHGESKVLYANPDDGIEGQKRAVEAFGLSHHVFLVLISPYDVEEHEARKIEDKLREILKKHEYKHAILVSDVLMEGDHRDFHLFNEKIGLEDFTETFRKKLLKKKNIIFQDQTVSLEELLSLQTTEDYANAVNEELLEKLVKGEFAKVGVRPSEMDEQITKYYINRIFKNTVKEVDNEGLLIKKSDSCKDQINKELKDDDEKKKEEKIVPEEKIFDEIGKVILIADSAGMGKSTVLTKLAMTIKEKDPHLLVLKVELNEYTSFLKEASRRSRNTTSIEELLNSKHETKLTSHLEKFIFSMDSKVVLMLDGIDEISPDYTQLILEVLRQCQKAPNFAKIFITTRPHMIAQLEEVLEVQPYILEPFTEQNQIDFLTSYWTHNLNIVDEQSKQECTKYAKEIIDKLTKMNVDSTIGNTFAAIPLQVRMLAEIFQEQVRWTWKECKEHLLGTQIKSELPEITDITKLYEMFIKKKLDIFVDKGNPTGNPVANHFFTSQFEEYFSLHQTLALDIILPRNEGYLFSCYQHLNKDREINVLKMGIIQMMDGKFNFVHRSFAEYFVAKSLLTELLSLNQNRNFLALFIDEILNYSQFKVVRAFLDHFLRGVVDSLPPDIFKNYRPVGYNISYYNLHLIHNTSIEGLVEIMRLILKSISFKIVKDREVSYIDIPLHLRGSRKSRYGKMLSNIYRHFIRDSNRKSRNVRGTLKVLQWLTCRGGVNIKLDGKRTPLHYAIQHGHLNMVKYLLEHGANLCNTNNDWSVLHIAASRGHLDIVKLFVEMGTDINHNIVGLSPLLLAAYYGKLDVVKFLFDQGAETIVPSSYNVTALHCAALRGRLHVVEFLLGVDMEVDYKNGNGWTALHLAARWNYLETVDFLVHKGANPYIRTDEGGTVVHIAAAGDNVDVIQYFLQLGVDINCKDNKGNTALHVASKKRRLGVLKFLVDQGADINIRNERNESVLHLAVTSRCVDCVQFLLGLNIDLNITDAVGNTALHNAASGYFVNCVKLLAEHGSDINCRDCNSRTPLHIAALKGNVDTVKVLVDFGADHRLVDIDGMTPLLLATKYNHSEVVKLLLNQSGMGDNEAFNQEIEGSSQWDDDARSELTQRNFNEGDGKILWLKCFK